jgi:soluble lytic murein transglycosylase-like protein
MVFAVMAGVLVVFAQVAWSPANHSPLMAEATPLVEPAGSSTSLIVNVNAATPAAALPDQRQRALAAHLARRYRLAVEPTEMLVGAAHAAASQVGLDPLLLLAVMAIESRFNPIAESVMGAKGLMQVIPKFHRHVVSKHGGEEAMLEPAVNILIGAHILKDYIRRTGSLEAGLQFYNGSLWDESTQYAGKVLAEKDRLRQALQSASPSQRI